VRYINGKPRRIGYLGELRLDRRRRGQFGIIRGGYQFFEELAQIDPAEYYFTSIASDNEPSIRLLERGLAGMPAYTFLGEFATLVIPAGQNALRKRKFEAATRRLHGRGLRYSPACRDQYVELASFLNRTGSQHQLAVTWNETELQALTQFGLQASDFQLVLDGLEIVGCAAIWDQCAFRQTVVRGYSRRLAFARPWLNFGSHIFGTPRLPGIGSILANALLSPLAVSSHDTQLLLDLVHLCAARASEKGLEFLTLGFGAQDSRAGAVCGAFRCHKYLSRLYQVNWPGIETNLEALDGRAFLPDVAFL
jgi:hypothetical protein